MATVTTIKVGIRRIKSLGDFNSVQVNVEAEAALEEGDDPEAVANGLREFCRNHGVTEIARSYPPMVKQVQNLFLGMKLEPVDEEGNFIPEDSEVE